MKQARLLKLLSCLDIMLLLCNSRYSVKIVISDSESERDSDLIRRREKGNEACS